TCRSCCVGSAGFVDETLLSVFVQAVFKIHRTWTALRSQKRICARNKAKGCTMPRDLKLFHFAFFLMRGRAKKILVFMIRNSSCKFDNVA
ncbi:hypothetical protein GBAR_LOCUS11381, partial [Geodia barretti]